MNTSNNKASNKEVAKETYLPCSIYRSSYDSTCNLLHGYRDAYLPIAHGFMTIDKIELNATRKEINSYPIPLVIKRKGNYVYAEPNLPVPNGMIGYMFGGTYVCTSDSRYSETFGFSYPIPIHDRIETQAQYDALSI